MNNDLTYLSADELEEAVEKMAQDDPSLRESADALLKDLREGREEFNLGTADVPDAQSRIDES